MGFNHHERVIMTAAAIPNKGTSTAIKIILELIEEARRTNHGTVTLSRHMQAGDVETHAKAGVIFRQFLNDDILEWAGYFEANKTAPQLNDVRSDLTQDFDGFRVDIRLVPAGPERHPHLSYDSPAVIAAANQLGAQVRGMSDVLARKWARMILLAAAPAIRAQELRDFAVLLANPDETHLYRFSARETIDAIVFEATARADEIAAGTL